MSIKTTYLEKLYNQINVWEKEIELLEIKIAKISNDVKLEAQKEIEDLKSKQKSIKEKAKELENTSSEVWSEAEGILDQKWQELKAVILSIKKYF